MKTLSVIIPVYNSKDYLEDCVASVAAVSADCRTMFIGEIILVDDGSTDGSSELCDRLAATESAKGGGIRVIHQSNRGVSAARNAGLHAATGDYILFVDSDDTVDSRKLAELMQTVGQDTAADMAVFGMSFDYYAGDRVYRQDLMLPPVEGIKTYDECAAMLFRLFKSNAISSLCNKLIRRSVIENAGIRLREDMFLYEDLEFSLRVLARCGTFCFCAEPIYHYRQTADEGNAGRRLKKIAHIPEIVDKIEEALVPFDGQEDILLSLYLVLAREKISCASRDETDAVCGDFQEWIDAHGLFDKIRNSEHGMLLYRGQSAKLLIKRNKTRLRHGIANAVKKTVGDFRRW